MKLTGRFEIELDEDAVFEKRQLGFQDTAIIHEICDEIQGFCFAHLTELGEAQFTDCEIVQSKEKEILPF